MDCFTILNVPQGSTLVITKIGFESQEIQTGPGTERLTIDLLKVGRENGNPIEEIVVTGRHLAEARTVGNKPVFTDA